MSKSNPFVNIIILNFNGYEDTIECINSIKKINYPFWRITLIDNKSTDKSSQKLLEIYGKDRKVKLYFSKKNVGFSGGNNLGMRKDFFNADFFLLLNNDVVVEKSFLEKLIGTKKDLIAPRIYDYFSKKRISEKDSPGQFNLFLGGGRKLEFLGDTIKKVDYASGCCWLIKKDLYLETGGFDENYFAYNEEIEWAYRLKLKGYNFYIHPKSKIWHKGSRTSKKISGLKIKLIHRNLILFEREYANNFQYFVFIIYFLFYKIPKSLFRIVFSGKNILKKINYLFYGLKEGLFYKLGKIQNKNVWNKRI